MKKYIVGGTGKCKLFEIAFESSEGDLTGTKCVKVVAKDVIEAVEVLLSLEKIDTTDIEYISECKCEKIIA